MTVQGAVKEHQPDGLSQRGGNCHHIWGEISMGRGRMSKTPFPSPCGPRSYPSCSSPSARATMDELGATEAAVDHIVQTLPRPPYERQAIWANVEVVRSVPLTVQQAFERHANTQCKAQSRLTLPVYRRTSPHVVHGRHHLSGGCLLLPAACLHPCIKVNHCARAVHKVCTRLYPSYTVVPNTSNNERPCTIVLTW